MVLEILWRIDGNTVVFPRSFCPRCHRAWTGVRLSENGARVKNVENMHEVAQLSPSDNAFYFAYTVAISGNTIVVGDADMGSAYVFVEPTGGWKNMTATAKLVVRAGQAALSAGRWPSAAARSSWVLRKRRRQLTQRRRCRLCVYRTPGGWQNMGPTATLTLATPRPGDFFGFSAGISGNAIVVGSTANRSGTSPYQREAYVFVEPTAVGRT